jgi:hypothetical protein
LKCCPEHIHSAPDLYLHVAPDLCCALLLCPSAAPLSAHTAAHIHPTGMHTHTPYAQTLTLMPLAACCARSLMHTKL